MTTVATRAASSAIGGFAMRAGLGLNPAVAGITSAASLAATYGPTAIRAARYAFKHRGDIASGIRSATNTIRGLASRTRSAVKSASRWAKAARTSRLNPSRPYVPPRRDPAPARVVPGFTRTGGYYKRMSGCCGGEDKFFDTALSFNVDVTGEVPATGQLCLIPQDNTQSGRDGLKAMITSIQIRGTAIFGPAATTIGVCNSYIYVVLDTQANGAAAAVTDVLTSSSMSVAMINMANSERFRILKRLVIKCQSAAGIQGAFSSDEVAFDWYSKVNIPIIWSSTTGAITEIRSNNIFLLAGSDTLADDLVAVSGTCRLRFNESAK